MSLGLLPPQESCVFLRESSVRSQECCVHMQERSVRSQECGIRMQGISFFEYISDIINKAAKLQPNTPITKYRDLLPDKWKLANKPG